MNRRGFLTGLAASIVLATAGTTGLGGRRLKLSDEVRTVHYSRKFHNGYNAWLHMYRTSLPGARIGEYALLSENEEGWPSMDVWAHEALERML